MKKKIALIVDSDNWALANIANAIKKYSNKYEYKIIPRLYLDNIGELYLAAEECVLIHFLWRLYIYNSNIEQITPYAESLGFTYEDFSKKFMSKPITTGIYDHLYINEDRELTREILEACSKYYVSSKILYDIYNKLIIGKKPSAIITDGYDPTLFYPKNLERFDNISNREIVIGWVGNSKWGDEKEDLKGLHTIIKPAINELKKEGFKIKEFYADRNVKMISHDKMVDYYSQIDVLLCASVSEGTPNPVLEAMACGVPIITTNVGIVSEALGIKQKKYIIKQRTKDALKKAIKDLIISNSTIKELSDENIIRIEKWKWQEIVPKIEKFFDEALKEKNKAKEEMIK